MGLLNGLWQAIFWQQNERVNGKPQKKSYQKKNHSKKFALKPSNTSKKKKKKRRGENN